MKISARIMTALVSMLTLAMTACETNAGDSAKPSVVASEDVSIIGISIVNSPTSTSSGISASLGLTVSISSGNSTASSINISVTATGWTTTEQSEMIKYMGEVLPYISEFGTDYFFEAEDDEEGGYVYIETSGDHMGAYAPKIVALGFILEEEGTGEDYYGDECDYKWYIKEKDSYTYYVIELLYYPAFNKFNIFGYPWTN